MDLSVYALSLFFNFSLKLWFRKHRMENLQFGVNFDYWDQVNGVTGFENPFIAQEFQFPWASYDIEPTKNIENTDVEPLVDWKKEIESELTSNAEKDCSFISSAVTSKAKRTEDLSMQEVCTLDDWGQNSSKRIDNLQSDSGSKIKNFNQWSINNPVCQNSINQDESCSSPPNGESEQKLDEKFLKSWSKGKKCGTNKGFDSKLDYSSLVNDILNRSDQYTGDDLSYRKDVQNKKILRAFRKYTANLFKSCKRPSRSKKPFKKVKEDLVKEAIQIGIIQWDNWVESFDDFKEFVWWMAMAKVTNKTKRLFNYKNKSIRDLSDILESYSHEKLESKIFVSSNFFNSLSI